MCVSYTPPIPDTTLLLSLRVTSASFLDTRLKGVADVIEGSITDFAAEPDIVIRWQSYAQLTPFFFVKYLRLSLFSTHH